MVVKTKLIFGSKSKRTSWWTEEVTEAVLTNMEALRRWMKTRGQEDIESYVDPRPPGDYIKNRTKAEA